MCFCLGEGWSVYLPLLVRTMMAPAQHLKEDSTAPMAVTSVGSQDRGVRRRSSSNSCWWKMAASASLQIWQRVQVRHGGVIRGQQVRQDETNDIRTQKHTPSASWRPTPQETVPWQSPQITWHSRPHPARRWPRHCSLLWLGVGGTPCSPASKQIKSDTKDSIIGP